MKKMEDGHRDIVSSNVSNAFVAFAIRKMNEKNWIGPIG